MEETQKLLQELIKKKSLSPKDEGCCELILNRLQKIGFSHFYVNANGVTNLWAFHGVGSPVFAFAGHTDVVPPGDESQWHNSPWQPTIKDGFMYGRGACDMKSGVASSVIALEEFVINYPNHKGTIALLLTSDEETVATHGTKIMMEHLHSKKIFIDYAIVTEPSSKEVLGDTISIGRRGSLNGNLKISGLQGHIAYPDLALNPINPTTKVLSQLIDTKWDAGNNDFPPTSFQVSNIAAGTGALNIIPAISNIDFNFRYNTEHSSDELKSSVEAIIKKYSDNYSLSWSESGKPFISKKGELLNAVSTCIKKLLGLKVKQTTDGGISDARFIAPYGTQTIELGHIGSSLHQVNEYVKVDDIEKLTMLYLAVMENLFEVN